MKKTSSVSVMGYAVFNHDLTNIKIDFNKKIIVNTINPHSYITAKQDTLFENALQSSDILIPDGSGIVVAAKQIYGKSIKKIAGSDLHFYLLSEINKIKGKVFYMGASEDTLIKIKKRIKKEYSNIIVGSYSPPFKPNFSDKENLRIIKEINSFSPDILFIGMTAPKQEKWLYLNREKLDFKIASSIGAVFDFFAGTVERPSRFWVDLHLEWLVRLIKEPKRLWRRNFVSTPLFLLDVFLYKVGLRNK